MRTLSGVSTDDAHNSVDPPGHGALATPHWFFPRRLARVIGGLLIPIAILGVWQAVTATGLIPSYRLPAPAAVVDAAIQLSESGELWFHVAISVQRVLLGFTIGSTVGLIFAALVGLTRVGDILLTPIFAALRAVPSLALVPLLLLWMGIGEDSKVTLIAIGAFFPVFTTVSGALRQVDPQSVEMARSFSLRGFALFRTVQLPAVVPSIMSGLRLAMAQSWLFLVAAELLAAAMGLGFLLTLAQSTGRVDQILLAIVLLAILGTLSNAVLSGAQKYLLRRWI
ncbi:sulfonate transport system permease protein [Microbacterium halimionae]|uniref:Sulfonate transport system permease protein n=1 Tax=Microbacterium halimionae TaxID=1526413 RepID=A0A7W3PL22_9MICO|nr:ABC transporter permease subunit [Microbacterium halimionae]MBA8816135.1 sulfonate transport system permease protein [Microbacterium halimionae]NII96337.1 sulfonate transport system permease protein [Microbacterium halimionae]